MNHPEFAGAGLTAIADAAHARVLSSAHLTEYFSGGIHFVPLELVFYEKVSPPALLLTPSPWDLVPAAGSWIATFGVDFTIVDRRKTGPLEGDDLLRLRLAEHLYRWLWGESGDLLDASGACVGRIIRAGQVPKPTLGPAGSTVRTRIRIVWQVDLEPTTMEAI